MNAQANIESITGSLVSVQSITGEHSSNMFEAVKSGTTQANTKFIPGCRSCMLKSSATKAAEATVWGSQKQ